MIPKRRARVVGPTNYFWHPRTNVAAWYAWSGFYVCVFTFALTTATIARVPAACIGVAAIILAARLWSMGVYEERDALVVRNLHRTYRLRWSDVTGVDGDDHRLRITTRKGDVYPFWGSLQRQPSPDAEQWLARQVQYLTESVETHRVTA